MSQSDPFTVALEIYAAIAGLICLPIVRPPFAKWYRSSFWLISGSGPVEILLKQVFYRLGYELFVFGLSCAFGAVGGWIIALFLYSARSKAVSDDEGDKA
ncbi:MAG: hypothetical protein WBQ17_14285 [Rhizomicrobium sp.]